MKASRYKLKKPFFLFFFYLLIDLLTFLFFFSPLLVFNEYLLPSALPSDVDNFIYVFVPSSFGEGIPFHKRRSKSFQEHPDLTLLRLEN